MSEVGDFGATSASRCASTTPERRNRREREGRRSQRPDAGQAATSACAVNVAARQLTRRELSRRLEPDTAVGLRDRTP